MRVTNAGHTVKIGDARPYHKSLEGLTPVKDDATSRLQLSSDGS